MYCVYFRELKNKQREYYCAKQQIITDDTLFRQRNHTRIKA